MRDRLLGKEFDPELVERAIRRLRSEGALDDQRTASIYARRAALVKHRGPRRAVNEIEAAGIAPTLAREAVSAAYAEVKIETVIRRALNKRLTGPVHDRTQFHRLYQYLVRQGFDGTMAIEVLRSHSTAGTIDHE